MAKATPKVLSREQWFRVTEWVRTKADDILGRCPTMTDLSREIKEAIGINPQSLAETCKIIGINWKPKVLVGAAAGKSLKFQIDVLDARVKEQEEYIVRMRAEYQREVKELKDQITSMIASLDASTAQVRGVVNFLLNDLNLTVPGYVNPLTVSARVNHSVSGGK